MTPKSTKKQHLAKNPYRNWHEKNANINPASSRKNQRRNVNRSSNHSPTTPSSAKIAPKPPHGGYFIWGRHTVFAALANLERHIQKIYVSMDCAEELKGVLSTISSGRRAELPEAQMIDRVRLDGISGRNEKAVHQGIAAAVWPLNQPNLDAFIESFNDQFVRDHESPVRLLLLDQLSDPRNVGAIMRSARAFGAAGIITTIRNAAEENGVLARTASGALEHVPLIRVVNLARAIRHVQACGFIVAGLASDGSAEIGTLAQHRQLAIMLGSEGNGLRRLSRDHCDVLVRININSETESLNVSNAAAIALFASNQQLKD